MKEAYEHFSQSMHEINVRPKKKILLKQHFNEIVKIFKKREVPFYSKLEFYQFPNTFK